jgi:DNA-binding NarL/FixJ family response regulator
MIRIMIVDDHAVVRSGIKHILSETSDIKVTAEAASGAEAIKLIAQKPVDMVLLDISMPEQSGLEMLKVFRTNYPAVQVLILTMHPEEQYAVRTLKNGASGYLTKDSAPSELITAIRKISSGGKYITASLAERLAGMLDISVERSQHEKLSDRELEVMLFVASGKSMTEIAYELNLSIKTVSTYKSRILEKMDLNGTADIIRYAIKNNLSY